MPVDARSGIPDWGQDATPAVARPLGLRQRCINLLADHSQSQLPRRVVHSADAVDIAGHYVSHA